MNSTAEAFPVNHSGRKAGAAQAWVLILTMFLPILAIIALAPALPTLLEHFKDVPNSKTIVPMLITVPALCIAIFGGIAGWLTDRYGRRNLLLGTLLLYGFGGLAPFVLQTFQTVFVGRVMLGIAEAFILTIGNALLADYYTKEDQHKWLMIQGLVGPALGTLFLAISGKLASMGWQWPFAVYAITFPILLFGFLYLFEPVRRAKEVIVVTGVPFPWKTVAVLCAVGLGTAIAYFVQVINFSLVLREIGVRDQALIGRISGFASIAVPFGAFLFKRNTRFSIHYQLAMVYLLMGIGLLGIGLSHDYRLSAALALFQQLSAGMAVPCLVAWALGSLPLEHRGRGMGLWAASFFIGQFVSPLIVSALRNITGGLLPAVATIGGICLVVAVTCVLLSWRNAANAVVT